MISEVIYKIKSMIDAFFELNGKEIEKLFALVITLLAIILVLLELI